MAFIKGSEIVLETLGATKTHMHRGVFEISENLKTVGPGGDYTDLNAALADGNQALLLKNGTYTLTSDHVIDYTRPFILYGEDMRKTIIDFDNYRFLFEVNSSFRPGGNLEYSSTAGTNVITITTGDWNLATEGIQVGDFIALYGEPSHQYFRITGFPSGNQIQVDRNVQLTTSSNYEWTRTRFRCDLDATSGVDIVTLNAPSGIDFNVYGVKPGWILELDRYYEIIEVGSNWLKLSHAYLGSTQTYTYISIEVAHKHTLFKNINFKCNKNEELYVGYGSGWIEPILENVYFENDTTSTIYLTANDDGMNGRFKNCYFIGITADLPAFSTFENVYMVGNQAPAPASKYINCTFNLENNIDFYTYGYADVACEFRSCRFINVSAMPIGFKSYTTAKSIFRSCTAYVGTTKYIVANSEGRAAIPITTSGNHYISHPATLFCDTTSGFIRIYLDDSQGFGHGDRVRIYDVGNNAATNPIYVNPMGYTINGGAPGTDDTLNTNGIKVEYEFDGADWKKIVL
ncbi:MAG: hypothetical protein KatS3mg002_0291 [Candidatus Woesearchaeota archaeon]|nr:MAG: hypothetical protein KatS3mg002_0291 [Candidatus Woesearchaeota archaeon]